MRNKLICIKTTLEDYIEIILTLAIIAGLFMPYVYGGLPIEVIFGDSIDLITILAFTVPLMVTVPVLLILIFKDVLKDSILNVLKPLFIIVYLIVLVNYGYILYDTSDLILSDENLVFLISIILSLILLLLSLKYATSKMEKLKNIFLAIMTLPIVFSFISFAKYDFEDFNYGAYTISVSFILHYIIAIYTIYKHHIGKTNKTIPIS